MIDDEYRELLENARDSLHDLLTATKPGTGLLLHSAYSSIERQLDGDGGESRSASSPDNGWREKQRERERSDKEWRERRAAWKRMPRPDRDRLARELLGEDRLTIGELAERFDAALPDCMVFDSDLRSVVRRLFAAGELAREGERWRKGNSIRYRYYFPHSGNSDLSGPIADLERTFHERPNQEGASS